MAQRLLRRLTTPSAAHRPQEWRVSPSDNPDLHCNSLIHGPLMRVRCIAENRLICQEAYHSVDCSQAIRVECHSLDSPYLRCNSLVKGGIKDMDLASGLLDDVLLECRLSVGPESI